jgi:hypothetical protein
VDIDSILNKISLAFGVDNLQVIFPEDMIIDLTLFRISNIDASSLDEELISSGKLYILFETILAHVSDRYSRQEEEVKRLEAVLSLKYEKSLVASDDRVSDKKIDKLVNSDIDYIAAVDKELEYKNLVVTFSNILKSLDKRHDMLTQLSAKRNKEISTRV